MTIIEYYQEIYAAQIRRDEKVLDCWKAKTRPHFLIRICPFVPDLLTRTKKYLLVLTNHRLLIIRTTNAFNKFADEKFKKVIADLPLLAIESIHSKTGFLSSGVKINARHKSYRFKDVPESSVEEMASKVQFAKAQH